MSIFVDLISFFFFISYFLVIASCKRPLIVIRCIISSQVYHFIFNQQNLPRTLEVPYKKEIPGAANLRYYLALPISFHLVQDNRIN